MTAYEAALQILTEAQKPLPLEEITTRILEAGLWQSRGQTPEATVGAQIYRHIKHHGDQSPLVQVGPKTFAVKKGASIAADTDNGSSFLKVPNANPASNPVRPAFNNPDLTSQIKQHNDWIRKALQARLLSLEPEDFEKLMAQLLAAMGFESVEVTNFSSDGGLDVRGTLVVGDVIRTRMAVQVKKWKRNIQAHNVQQVRGSLRAHEQGLIITTSNFSKGATREAAQADKTPIALMNGEQLVSLLIEHRIGVESNSFSLFELKEAFTEEGFSQSD